MQYYHVSDNSIPTGALLSTSYIPAGTVDLATFIAGQYSNKVVLHSAAKKAKTSQSGLGYLQFLKGQAEGMIEAVRQASFPNTYSRLDNIFLTDNLTDAMSFGTKNRSSNFHVYEVELIDPAKLQFFDFNLYESIKNYCDTLYMQKQSGLTSFFVNLETQVKLYLSHGGALAFKECLTPDKNAKVIKIIR